MADPGAQSVSPTPLSPLAFLRRSAEAFPDKAAIIDGERTSTYAEFAAHASRLGAGLRSLGVSAGDRVAYLCPNTTEMLVGHFALPSLGAPIVPINTRLGATEVKQILDHSGAKAIVVDAELASHVEPVLAELSSLELVVRIGEDAASPLSAPGVKVVPYEDLLKVEPSEPTWEVDDELDTIAINYTSGTTGTPKGVMYTHRGAYLNGLGEIIHSAHSPRSVYLWTLPMFHCNGWCTTWGVTAIGGTHVCLRAVRSEEIWAAIDRYGVTHLNAAPTVLTGMVNDPNAKEVDHQVVVTTAGAPPSPTIIQQLESLRMELVHVYGLTETYGPYSVCQWQDGWRGLGPAARAGLLARQGLGMIQADRLRVVNEEMVDVPADGQTMGELVMRGNNVMKGYFDDEEATAEAFRGGWFHSGDLGVMHPDGYVQIHDRAKDIVISGGENVSTIEVEAALQAHPAVLEAAVIGVPHEKWGERPLAFVVTKGAQALEQETLREYLRGRIAHFKVPDEIRFVSELPKTATGKVQKHVLRRAEVEGHNAVG
jgi:fatty-acyl-CoA synthase